MLKRGGFLRFIVAILFIFTFAFATLSDKDNYSVDQYIADSLDLPLEFLQSERFLKYYQKYERLKKYSFIDVNRVETYFIPELEKILEAQGIPEIFLFMAMAESNFASHAKSSKKAVGIWQFMPKTAQKYGLRIDEFVDERKDPIKATNAAVKYLKYLHKMFGKWYLAALAYNAGEGTVLKAIKRAGSDKPCVLLDPKKKYLPKESRVYLYKIASLARLSYDLDSKMSQELGYVLARGEDFQVVPVKVKGAEPLSYIAHRIKLKSAYLKSLNPHLKHGFTPPVKSYAVYIPRFKYEDFKKYYKPSNAFKNFLTYKVRPKDSLYKIAKKFDVRISTLKRFNNLRSNTLRVGQKLIIPVLKENKRIYKVKKGDTILKIAKRFGVDPKKLKQWNDKKDNFLRAGEKLVVLY